MELIDFVAVAIVLFSVWSLQDTIRRKRKHAKTIARLESERRQWIEAIERVEEDFRR